MKKFSEKIVESKNSFEIFSKEIADYTKKMSSVLPKEVQYVMSLLSKYNIEDKEVIDNIKSGKKYLLTDISKQYNISIDRLNDIKTLLKELKSKIRLLPQYQTRTERELFLAGKLAMNDITLDLDSEKGRNAIAKQYSPLVFKFVKKYEGTSNLDKSELLSAGLEGLTYAMNTFRKSDDNLKNDFGEDVDINAGKKSKASFYTYATWCIMGKILSEIHNNSSVIKIGQYGYNKLKQNEEPTNIIYSLDAPMDLDDQQSDKRVIKWIDKVASTDSNKHNENKRWEELIKRLNNNNILSKRDIQVFLKYFGLGNQEQTTGVKIAKEFNISSAMVTVIIKNVLNFIKKDRYSKELLSEIADMYNESLVVNLYQLDKTIIKENLLNDDIYLLLEEITKWDNKSKFENTINKTLKQISVKEAQFIYDCLIKGFDYLDSNYKTNKKLIIWFLSELYPTENISKLSDVGILELMEELIDYNNKFKIDWK
jgi:RNA polymerase sigma factor (sigma-70 family)